MIVEIRHATQADHRELTRLAQRDSAPLPEGRLIVALVDGEPRAALSLDSGEAIADPFRRSAHLVAALRACARPQPRRRRGRRADPARALAIGSAG